MGEHLLLQTRMQTLDRSLRSTFRQWYHSMSKTITSTDKLLPPLDRPTIPYAPQHRRRLPAI